MTSSPSSVLQHGTLFCKLISWHTCRRTSSTWHHRNTCLHAVMLLRRLDSSSQNLCMG